MADTQRKSIDCRDYPGESGCTVRIEGTEDEVLDTAVSPDRVGIAKHGHADTPELRDEIRKLFKQA